MTEWPAEDVLLETGRLVLRQFTMSDADNLASLDADPDVMRFVTGGLATSREEIKDSILPGFMAWYRCPGGYGCWAADEKSTGAFLGWFRFHPRQGGPAGEIVLGFRLRKRPGERATPPKDHRPWCVLASPNSAPGGSSPRPWP